MKIKEQKGNFIITDFEELEAYKIACKIENDGIYFYKSLLDKTSGRKLKETLNFLLGEEKKHLKTFTAAQLRAAKDKEDAYEDEDILNSMDYGIFQPYQNIDELNKVLDNSLKALKLGIVIEDKSIKFYTACQEKVSSPEAKKELSGIIREEEKNKHLLSGLLKDY